MLRTITFLALAVVWNIVACHADEKPQRFDLQSVALQQPVAGASAIGIRGRILGAEGKAELHLDPNACSIGGFGDREICTKIAVARTPVTLQQTRQRDPLEKGRRLFQIDGPMGEGRFSLIVPDRPRGEYRLVYEKDEARVVIPLEHVAPAKPPTKPMPVPEPGKMDCNPLPITVAGTTAKAKLSRKGDSVVLVVTGNMPNTNTRVRFNPVTYIKQPEYWQIDVLECSNGPIRLPAIAKYEVSQTIKSLGTKGIVLVFRDGKSLRLDTP